MLTARDIATLRGLEESLWRPETRYDADHMEALLAPDFAEFGRSGRTYTRAECLAMSPEPFVARLPLDSFAVRSLGADTVLVTYVSELLVDPIQRANRASIWSRNDGTWRLRFHQGTPRT